MSPVSILLVEDNPVNQMIALAYLRKSGYTADVATDGVEAIDAFRQQQYDIILMDIHMPKMDGLEATRQIRSVIGSQQQPYIIAVTARAFAGARMEYLSCGMDDYVSKPLQPASFIAAIEKAVGVQSSYF